MESGNKKIEAVRAEIKDKATAEQEQQLKELEAAVSKSRAEEEEIIKSYGVGQKDVRQLIDLALLGNGLLKGEDLSRFISRSVEMM